MITNLHIKNFKSLKDTGKLSLKGINILAGLNGMGKSSLVQSLLLLRQSDEIDKGVLKLKNGFVNLGTFEDALFQSATTEEISFELGNAAGTHAWTFSASKESDQLISTGNSNQFDATWLRGLAIFNDLFQYISADRVAQIEMHAASSSNVNKGFLGTKGEYAVHYLEAVETGTIRMQVPLELRHSNFLIRSELRIQTDAWLGEISPGVKVITKQITSEQVQLGFSFGQFQTNPFKPKNVGFGLSYSLAVIVALLTSKPNSIIIIENPEAHLHPQGQAKLAELIAKAARNGAQIILETHSDHIINGIRVMTRLFYNDTNDGLELEKRTGISNEDVAIFWFERDEEDFSSKIIPVKIEANAGIKKSPIGFFDQMNIDLKKILGF
jgi:predicted ATPase